MTGLLNVLVAEDNPHHQILTLRLLGQLGFRADLVEDGVSVLGAIKRKRYQLLLLDLNMPLMNGFEVARAIVREYSRTRRPIMIAVTANTELKAREKCLEAGMDEYLPKPISLEDLRSVLGGFGFVARDEGKEFSLSSLQNDGSIEMQNRLDLLVSETDPEFVTELINKFVEEGWPDLSEIERAVRARDWEALKMTAHSLKGASRNLGAEKLGKFLENVEQIAEARRGVETIEIHALKSLFENIVEELKQYSLQLSKRTL
jgi:CheY-like chemotaxis protein